MTSLRQLVHTLVGGALIASGMTAVVAVAGPVPAASAAVTTPKIITMQRGQQAGAFLTDIGDIYTFGNNANGATGLNLTSGNTDLPTKIADFLPVGEKVVQMSFGGTTSIASGLLLTDGGSVYSWGYDGAGALGDDVSLVSKAAPAVVSPTWGSDEPVSVSKVAGGGRVITESGHVYAWGDNGNGQTGIDNGGDDIAIPEEVPGLYFPDDKVVQITGGLTAMVARTASGVVLGAGSQFHGQRGDGTNTGTTQNYAPAITELAFTGLPTGDSIISIGSGIAASFAVSATGKVWGWGQALNGRFGDGNSTNYDQATPLPLTVALADADDQVVDFAMGSNANTTMLRTQQGHLYTAGTGNNGQLGDGGTSNKAVFAKITSWPGRGANEPIVGGVMGGNSGFAVTQKGRLYAWGNSSTSNQGGIGIGTQTPNIVTPMLVAGPAVLPDFDDAVDASVTGTVKVGTSLTASGGTYAPSDATLGYEWKIGSDTVSTTSSYTPKLADAGKSLTLIVTGSKTGFADSVSTTTAQTVDTVQGFTGTLKEGETLTASDTTGTNTWGLSSSSTCSSPTTETGPTFVLPSGSAGTYVQLSQTLDGRTGSGTCVGPIAAATSAATITGAATASGVKGQSFSYTPTVGGSPAPSVTVEGTLPTGVTVESSTGKLSGTPTVAGSFPVTLRASNGVGAAVTLDVAISLDDLVTGLSPTISGTPKVGVQMTASPGGSLVPSASDGATVTYTWQHESSPGTWTDLSGGATYTPAASEVGRVYRVKVTVAKAGFDSRTEYSTATEAAVQGTFSIDAPSISGTAKVGQTLTCAAAQGTAGNLSYGWTRGASSVSSDSTYTLTPDDHEQVVTCTVTSQRTGYTEATNEADSETVGLGTFDIDEPSVTGTAKVGETLTCAAAPETDGTVSYAWSRGVTALAAGATYELAAADRDEMVTCTVTSARAGYIDAKSSKESATVGYGSFSISAPAITGTAAVGQMLTCSAAAGEPGTASYVWTRGDTELATGATYVLTPDDRTEKVTCTATSARAGYTDATSSTDSETVDIGSFAIGAPSISGTTVVGKPLTCAAAPGTPGTLSYAWSRGATALTSGPTYTLTAADRAQAVTCTATSVRNGYTSASSQATSGVVSDGEITGLATRITGTLREGRMVRATTSVLKPSSAVRTYQWFADGKAIKGATGRTLLLRKPQAGRKLTVRVTATAGAVQLSRTSRARMVHSFRHRLVLLGNPTPGVQVTITATGLAPGRRYVIWLGGQERASGIVGRTGTVSRSLTFDPQTRTGLRRVRVSTYKKAGQRATTIHRTVRYR
ncbi:MAG: hypothetical protein ABWY58_03750 [Aeromicrobium sp.]